MRTRERLAEMIDACAAAEDWRDRSTALAWLETEGSEDERARNAIAAATHDPVDAIAFRAIRACGLLRIRQAVTDLVQISGWPSNFTQPDAKRKPVGVGAALTKNSLVEIMGSRNPLELRSLENEHFAEMRSRIAADHAARDERAQRADTVSIEGGPAIVGRWQAQEQNPFGLDTTDNPARVVVLEPFLIDRYLVTNAQYAEFLADGDARREFAHPDEGERGDPAPDHWDDKRFGKPDLPVVGVDWYGATAYAGWAGGGLPSEAEWERAARGPGGRIYPWGDHWEPGAAHNVATTFGTDPADLAEWETLLRGVSGSVPACPVPPVHDYPNGDTPEGVRQLSGSVWELTRTNYFTGDDMNPFLRGRKVTEFTHRPEAFHVLKGGTWTSPTVCLRADYRGRDLITDRHYEIGFRCVYDAPGDHRGD